MTEQTEIKAAEAEEPSAKKKSVKPSISRGALGALIPQDLDQTYRISQALAMAGEMVPQHFQERPEAIMAAIMRGMEIGLAPMQALSHIAVINGRACLWGDALPAIVQRHGHHIDVEIEGEGEKAVAVATLTRGDTGIPLTRRFSMADARKAGLLNKKGPWQQYPLRMLTHRARGWAIRDGAADALMGLQVAEEVQDYQPMRDVTPQPSGFAKLGNDARSKPATGEKAADDTQSPTDEGNEAHTSVSGDQSHDPDASTPADTDGPEIDPDSPAYGMGAEAASEGFIDRDSGPFQSNPESAVEHANWLAGYDSVKGQSDDREAS